MSIGNLIRMRRRAKRLTLADLAGRIGRNKSTVLRYETGAVRVSADDLQRIAGALGCNVTALLPRGAKRRAA
jgi:transcriptional regulator with XRE-family HTH domain